MVRSDRCRCFCMVCCYFGRSGQYGAGPKQQGSTVVTEKLGCWLPGCQPLSRQPARGSTDHPRLLTNRSTWFSASGNRTRLQLVSLNPNQLFDGCLTTDCRPRRSPNTHQNKSIDVHCPSVPFAVIPPAALSLALLIGGAALSLALPQPAQRLGNPTSSRSASTCRTLQAAPKVSLHGLLSCAVLVDAAILCACAVWCHPRGMAGHLVFF